MLNIVPFSTIKYQIVLKRINRIELEENFLSNYNANFLRNLHEVKEYPAISWDTKISDIFDCFNRIEQGDYYNIDPQIFLYIENEKISLQQYNVEISKDVEYDVVQETTFLQHFINHYTEYYEKGYFNDKKFDLIFEIYVSSIKNNKPVEYDIKWKLQYNNILPKPWINWKTTCVVDNILAENNVVVSNTLAANFNHNLNLRFQYTEGLSWLLPINNAIESANDAMNDTFGGSNAITIQLFVFVKIDNLPKRQLSNDIEENFLTYFEGFRRFDLEFIISINQNTGSPNLVAQLKDLEELEELENI